MERRQRLDLFADVERSADAIALAGRSGRGRRFREFSARARRIYETLERPFIRAPRPSPLELVRRAGLRGLADLWGIAPFATLWRALGEHFHDPRLRQLFGRYATYCGSSPFLAPATLMLIAHVEQDGVWLVDGGMHRLAVALARAGRRAAARRSATAHDVAEVIVTGDRAAGVRLATGERIDGGRGGRQRRCRGLVERPVRAGRRPRGAACTRRIAVAVGGDLVDGRPHRRLSAAPAHRVLLERLRRRVRRHLPARDCLPNPPSTSARRTATTAGLQRPGDRTLAVPRQRAASSDATHFDTAEIERCAARAFGLLERCGLRVDRQPRKHRRDDAGGLRATVPGDRRRAVRTGVARMAGVVRPARLAHPSAGPVSGGRQHPSGTGRADGGAVGAAGGAACSRTFERRSATKCKQEYSITCHVASNSPSRPTATRGGTSTR